MIIPRTHVFPSNISLETITKPPTMAFYDKDVTALKLRIGSNRMEHVEGLEDDFPYAFHLADLEKITIPWHWHEALEFNYVARGRVRVSTTGSSREFEAGQGFFMNSNVLAAMESLGGCVLESHLFHPVFLSGHFKSVFETRYLNPVIQNRSVELVPLTGTDANQKLLLQKLRRLAALDHREAEFQTRNLLSEIWLLLLEVLKTLDTAPPKNQERILTMMVFVRDNLDQKLTLEEIAGAAAVSTRECLRCFRDSIGQSPMEYLIHCRVDAAKKLLQERSLAVTDIALKTGFNSAAYFAKIFKRVTGKTPSQFRESI